MNRIYRTYRSYIENREVSDCGNGSAGFEAHYPTFLIFRTKFPASKTGLAVAFLIKPGNMNTNEFATEPQSHRGAETRGQGEGETRRIFPLPLVPWSPCLSVSVSPCLCGGLQLP